MTSHFDKSGSGTPPDHDHKTGPKSGNTDNVSALKRQPIKVTNLEGLSEDIFDKLVQKRTLAEQRLSKEYAEAAIPPGIYNEDDKTYWVLPSAIFKEDNLIGCMVVDFAKKLSAEIKIIPGEVELTKAYDEDLILGLWFGFDSSTNQRRNRSKKSLELGRTMSFSLIVKHVFLTESNLGVKALVKDQFFYGNNPSEGGKNAKVPYAIKAKLHSFFAESRWGDILFNILNSVAKFVGLSKLTNDEFNKVIAYNLVPLDQVMISHYPTKAVLNKKGKVTSIEVKKPKPIRASPLYKKFEIDLIRRVTEPLFSDLAEIPSQYESLVLGDGFDHIEGLIITSIRTRQDVLQRFANRTKLRLQDIRKIIKDSTIRKAKVSSENLDALLSDLEDPASSLVSDIMHIIAGVREPLVLLNYAFGCRFANLTEAKAYIYKLALDGYIKNLPQDHKSISALLAKQTKPDLVEVDYKKALHAYMKLRKTNGELKKQSLGIHNIEEFKLLGRARQLKGLIKNFVSFSHEMGKVDKYGLDIAVTLVSECKYTSIESAYPVLLTNFHKQLDFIHYGLKHQMLQRKLEKVTQNVVLELVREIEEVRESTSEIYFWQTAE